MQLNDFVRDGDGFLINREDWTPEFAQLCAEAEGVVYTEDLAAVVAWARTFYDESGMAPRIADFSKGYYEPKFGRQGRKAPIEHLANLTNGAGMKRVDKIAGLPKPTGCV